MGEIDSVLTKNSEKGSNQGSHREFDKDNDEIDRCELDDFELEVRWVREDRQTSKFDTDECELGKTVVPESLCQYMIDANRKIRKSGKPNVYGEKIPVHHGFDLEYLSRELTDYDDKEIVEFLRYGSPIGHEGVEPKPRQCKNHKGATDYPQEMTGYVHKERDRGSLIGPVDKQFRSECVVSPLSSRPKPNSDERRVIQDLSFPPGAAVNEGINKNMYMGKPVKVKLPTVEDLVQLVKKHGQGCALFKRDLSGAYKQMPVDPGDIHLLAFQWQGNTYCDTTLCMGLRSAVYVCQRVTNSIRYICENKGLDVLNYIDDFIGAAAWEDGEEKDRILGKVLENSGAREKKAKRWPSNTRTPFKGIMFDTVKLTLEVTPERLIEISEDLEKWLKMQVMSRQELQHIIGKLNFLVSCVRQGRVFICRLLNFLRGMSSSKKSKVPDEVRRDLRWWQEYLTIFQGVSMMCFEDWGEPDSDLATDACLEGCGGVCGNEYFHIKFPGFIQEKNLSINELELITVVVALKVWKKQLVGKRVVVFCDNETSVEVINRGRSRNEFSQNCLRELVFVAAMGDFEIRAVHIAGCENRLPDLLSRWELCSSYSQQFYQEMGGGVERFVYNGLFHFSNQW